MGRPVLTENPLFLRFLGAFIPFVLGSLTDSTIDLP
jgi:hypothetical protein